MPARAPIIFIKHAAPRVDGTVPACRWHLSESGRASCRDLAVRLAHCGLEHLVSSAEPKAQQTAELLARHLGIGSSTAPDLHEHARQTVPLFASPAEFRARVEQLFSCPDQLVFGEETAHAARTRFSHAVDRVIDDWPGPGPVTIIAHGTVISLLVADWCGVDGYPLWSQLGLPSYIKVDGDRRRIVDICPGL